MINCKEGECYITENLSQTFSIHRKVTAGAIPRVRRTPNLPFFHNKYKITWDVRSVSFEVEWNRYGHKNINEHRHRINRKSRLGLGEVERAVQPILYVYADD